MSNTNTFSSMRNWKNRNTVLDLYIDCGSNNFAGKKNRSPMKIQNKQNEMLIHICIWIPRDSIELC
jgi:hypothetical protein